jgi:hypothetical protein
MQIWSTIKRTRIIRVGVPRQTPAYGTQNWRLLALVGASMAAIVGISAAPALAASTGSSAGTINVTSPPVYSVTVTPSSFTFGNCSGASASTLSFPNGTCNYSGVTVDNTGSAGELFVSAGNATPSDSGTPWTLTEGGGTPGANEYTLTTTEGGSGGPVEPTPECDLAWAPSGGESCFSTAGESRTEEILLDGPQSSSDTSASFTTTLTWTATS